MLDFKQHPLSSAEIKAARKKGIADLRTKRLRSIRLAARNVVRDPKRIRESLGWLDRAGETIFRDVSEAWKEILKKRDPQEIADFLLGKRAEHGEVGDPLSGDFDEQIRISAPYPLLK